jgi:hypothetical protein
MSKYCLAFPPPNNKQIPIKKYGNHEYNNLVYDPSLNKLIFKGRMVEWRQTKTHFKKKNNKENAKQYIYEALVISDSEGKKRKIFKRKFDAFINNLHTQSEVNSNDKIKTIPEPAPEPVPEPTSEPAPVATQKPITPDEPQKEFPVQIFNYFLKRSESDSDTDGDGDSEEEEQLYFY